VLQWHVLIPALVLLALCARSVTFMLPACQDYMDEIYQPLQALKFFATHGQAFNKYGPMPNFILAPGYGVSLAYWKLAGTFGHPSDNFPYGFSHPFEQIGILIAESRVIFLLLGVICYGYLAHTLRLVTQSRWSILLAMLLCLATNFPLLHSLPTARPDSPMMAFSALALAMYIRILYLGLTLRRGIATALLVVFAASSKELAATMFVLPFLGLAFMQSEADPGLVGFRRTKILAITAIVGVIAYALLNIVYAPTTWLHRMEFWIAGPGIDSRVWGGSARDLVRGAMEAMADNLGPAGTIVAATALVAAVARRRKRLVLLTLPLISVVLLGVSQILYAGDRFYTIVALAMTPLVAIGLTNLFERLRLAPARVALNCALCLAVAVNLWFASFSWIYLHGVFDYQAERDVIANAEKDQKVFLLATFPRNRGSSRLERLGYHEEWRPIQDLIDHPTNLPQRIYATSGLIQFLNQARSAPARAAMMEHESGFDARDWHGLESLGYHVQEKLVPKTPSWFCFNWMPAVEQWKQLKTVIVYDRTPEPLRADFITPAAADDQPAPPNPKSPS
jgi:hypothetical protein